MAMILILKFGKRNIIEMMIYNYMSIIIYSAVMPKIVISVIIAFLVVSFIYDSFLDWRNRRSNEKKSKKI